METEKIRQRLTEIRQLPSTAKIISDLSRLIRDTSTSISDFELVIQRDPGMAAEVLKVANSPYYGLSKKISSLRLAITLLGIQEIYRIGMNLGLYKQFRRIFCDINFDFNQFWHHALKTARLAEHFAEEAGRSKTSQAYILGLLHDTGKLIFDQFFPDDWTEVLLQFARTGRDVTGLEQETLGVDHAWLAKELLTNWNFPDEILIPILYHHRPYEAEEHREMTIILHAADRIVAWLTPEEVVNKTTQEILTEDENWSKITQDYPAFNLLEDETKRREQEQYFKSLVQFSLSS